MPEKHYLFTYIIAYRHSIDRLKNIRKVIDWLAGFSGIELIIVEQDSKPKLPAYTLKGFRYIFTQSDLPFNKSWAFNVATKYATTPAIVFGDSDIVMDPNALIEGLKLLQTYESVSPYNRVIDLEPNEVNWDLNQLNQITRPGRGEEDVQKICLAGGIIMYRKESLEKIGGWSEDFIGWGGEDDFQSHKTQQLLHFNEMNAKCYHLYHPKVIPDMKYYQRNLNLLNTMVQYPKNDLIKYVNNSKNKNGFKNKYFDK